MSFFGDLFGNNQGENINNTAAHVGQIFEAGHNSASKALLSGFEGSRASQQDAYRQQRQDLNDGRGLANIYSQTGLNNANYAAVNARANQQSYNRDGRDGAISLGESWTRNAADNATNHWNVARGDVSGYGSQARGDVTGYANQARGDVTGYADQARGDVTRYGNQARRGLNTNYAQAAGAIGGGTSAALSGLNPYTRSSQAAQDLYNDYLGTGAGGAAGRADAYARLYDPNSAFMQGNRAELDKLNENMDYRANAAGRYGSGATALASARANNEFMNTRANQYLDRLAGQANPNVALAAANINTQSGRDLSGVYQGLGNQLGNLSTGIGNQLGQQAMQAGGRLGDLSAQTGNQLGQQALTIGGRMGDQAMQVGRDTSGYYQNQGNNAYNAYMNAAGRDIDSEGQMASNTIGNYRWSHGLDAQNATGTYNNLANAALGWGQAGSQDYWNLANNQSQLDWNNAQNYGNLLVNAANGTAAAAGTNITNMFNLAGAGLRAGATFAASDIRLKRDVERVGALPSGLPTYTFNYVWDDKGSAPRHGVMAHEVRGYFPDAVITDDQGYDMVDYARIG